MQALPTAVRAYDRPVKAAADIRHVTPRRRQDVSKSAARSPGSATPALLGLRHGLSTCDGKASSRETAVMYAWSRLGAQNGQAHTQGTRHGPRDPAFSKGCEVAPARAPYPAAVGEQRGWS